MDRKNSQYLMLSKKAKSPWCNRPKVPHDMHGTPFDVQDIFLYDFDDAWMHRIVKVRLIYRFDLGLQHTDVLVLQ